MTPWELQVIATSEGERIEGEYKLSLGVAWHGAALHHWDPKKFPPLRKFLDNATEGKKPKPQGVDERVLWVQFQQHNERVRLAKEVPTA